MPLTQKQPLKVGFDLDGVLLYNPARLARPVIKLVKKNMLHKKKVSFFVPRSSSQRFMWDLLHKSSLWIAPGIQDLYDLIDQKKIEAYIITGRFAHLKKNTQSWIDKLNRHQHFKKWYCNEKTLQPHLYKEALVKHHQLDIFIDDNYDIATYLNRQCHPHTQIYWIYNLFDRHLPFTHKFPDLKRAIRHLGSL